MLFSTVFFNPSFHSSLMHIFIHDFYMCSLSMKNIWCLFSMNLLSVLLYFIPFLVLEIIAWFLSQPRHGIFYLQRVHKGLSIKGVFIDFLISCVGAIALILYIFDIHSYFCAHVFPF